MGFFNEVNNWKIKSTGTVKANVGYICWKMAEGIIKNTPFDTGHALNNWQASLNIPDYSTNSPDDTQGRLALSKAVDNANRAAGNKFYLINSVEYIKRLEEGHSKKNSHMVQKTFTSIKNRLKQNGNLL